MLTTTLCADALARLQGHADLSQIIPITLDVVLGSLLVLGLWTPLAGILVVVLQFYVVLSSMTLSAIALSAEASTELHLLRAATGGCLTLLGPGAWSVDARLFGRRRVEISHR